MRGLTKSKIRKEIVAIIIPLMERGEFRCKTVPRFKWVFASSTPHKALNTESSYATLPADCVDLKKILIYTVEFSDSVSVEGKLGISQLDLGFIDELQLRFLS